MLGINSNKFRMNNLTFSSREQCMEAALTDALNWLETGGGDVVSGELFDSYFCLKSNT